MNRILTAIDVARRDNQPSVKEWLRITSIQLKMKGGCPTVFNGNMGTGKVHAYISNGRWMAICDEPGCAGCEYVDPQEPLFYCLTCGNGRSGSGKQVIFPKDRGEIEAAMLERAMVASAGNDEVTRMFNARPVHAKLRRDWMPPQLKAHSTHPALYRRVLVDAYGESPQAIRSRTRAIQEADHAGSL